MFKEEPILKIAGISAILTAITTFLLWLLPKLYDAPDNFEASIQLAKNPYYISRLWVNLLHIPLALIAYFGLAYKLRNRELPKVGIGMIWFIIWGAIEMIGISGIIFTVSKNWRANYASASETVQATLQNNIDIYFAIWDSMFFVLLIAFLLGTLFYGWATWKGKGLEKILSYLFWLAVPLTIIIMLSGYFGINGLNNLVDVIYPMLQPVSRFLLGLFLLKSTKTP